MHSRHLLFAAIVVLAGCATQPDRGSAERIDNARIDAHQAQLATIESWEFQARMAFFNDRDDERHTASIRWQFSPDEVAIRLTHPLRGTLAELEQTPYQAVLTDREGNQYIAEDIRQLLQQHLGIMLPVTLINDALLGRHPDLNMIDPVYYEDGSMAEYRVRLTDDLRPTNADDSWHIEFFNYQQAADSNIRLPHRLHLESDDYRIRLAITRWQINQDIDRD
ncbi:lipoprotein insertase outer membrane protein LolB [Aliidiomarina sp. Khilg15.8]